jgi:hypothetical protein
LFFFAKPLLTLALFVAGSLTFVVAGVVMFAVLASSGGPDEPVETCRNSGASPGSVPLPSLGRTTRWRSLAERRDVSGKAGLRSRKRRRRAR